MKFFIDTANLAMIQEAQDLGILDGVTTNPSLMAKEGISGNENIINHYKKICDIVDGDVSAEVISTNFDGMIKEPSTYFFNFPPLLPDKQKILILFFFANLAASIKFLLFPDVVIAIAKSFLLAIASS